MGDNWGPYDTHLASTQKTNKQANKQLESKGDVFWYSCDCWENPGDLRPKEQVDVNMLVEEGSDRGRNVARPNRVVKNVLTYLYMSSVCIYLQNKTK